MCATKWIALPLNLVLRFKSVVYSLLLVIQLKKIVVEQISTKFLSEPLQCT